VHRWGLGFSGVGGWRGTRFTPEFVYSSVCNSSDGQPASSPFPSAPPRTVLARFPGTRLSSGRILGRSALDITSTLLLIVPAHLTHFAMYQVFPGSDYYGVSVTMGLAPFRRSRVSLVSYVLARFRPSTHPYAQDLFPGISSCGLAEPAARRSGT
jgi:hypothetical protein